MNWILFNISLFNKFFLNKNVFILIKNQIYSTALIINFLIMWEIKKSNFFKKIYMFILSSTRNVMRGTWTPIFKRTSYIAFLSFLKRTIKRK